MEENIKETGIKDGCMEEVIIFGQMDSSMRESIIWIKNKDMVVINGRMVRDIMVNGWIIWDMEKVV